MRKTHLRSTILATALIVIAALTAHAQQLPILPDEHIVAIVQVDFRPSNVGPADVMKAYVAQAAHDPNILHIELLQSVTLNNHYTIVCLYKNLAAYQAHAAEDYVVKYRRTIDPTLGASYDERLYREAPTK